MNLFRTITLITVTLLIINPLWAGCCGMCEKMPTVQEAIVAVNNQLVSAYAQGDWNAIEALLSDDHVHNNIFGTSMDKEAFLSDLRSGTLTFNRYETTSMEVRDYGDACVATGLIHAEAVRDGNVIDGDFRFTRIFVKEGDTWKVALFHNTRVYGLNPGKEA